MFSVLGRSMGATPRLCMRVGGSGPEPVLRRLVVGAAEILDEAGYQGPDGGSLYMSLAMCTPWLVCPLTVLYTLSITKNSISTVSSELGIWMNRWHRSSEILADHLEDQ